MTEIADENSCGPSGTFRYQRRIVSDIAAFLFVGGGGYLLWLAKSTSHGPIPSVEIVMWALYALVAMILFIGAVGRSDVIVDEEGVSRRYLRLVPWGRMRWDNIRKVRVVSIANPLRYSTTSGVMKIIAIFPSVPPRFRLHRSGAVTLNDMVEQADEFMKIMNHYIAQHNIEIVELSGAAGERAVDHL